MFFHREWTLEAWPPTDTASQFLLIQYYCYWALETRHHGWYDIHLSPVRRLIKWTFDNLHCGASSSVTFTNLHCAPSASATFTNLHCVPSASVTFTNLHCVPSTSALSNLHCVPSTSAPSTKLQCVPSTSAPFTNLQCYASIRVAPISTVALLQLHHSTVNLHCLLLFDVIIYLSIM